MRITKTRTTVVGTPWRELVFLELENDTGLVGTSEVGMVSRTSTVEAYRMPVAERVFWKRSALAAMAAKTSGRKRPTARRVPR